MKLKLILFFLTFTLLNVIKAQDTVYLNGTNRVDFKVKPALLYYTNCSTKFNTASTTVRSISGVGKILFKPDGTGYIIPISSFKNGAITYYATSCKLAQRELIFSTYVAPPKDTIINTNTQWYGPKGFSYSTTTPTAYKWGRTIGNTSSVQYGSSWLKSLRSPTDIADVNGVMTISTGFVEGNSGLYSISSTGAISEIAHPLNGDIVLAPTNITSYDGVLYVAGFDSYGAISSAVIAYKNGVEVSFQYGKAFQCQWQDNPYKSGIHVNIAKITGLDADATTLYVYCGTKCYTYNRITGQSTGSVTVSIPTSIDKSSNGKHTVEMFSDKVTLNGKTICTTPTGPKLNEYNFIPKDFNFYSVKGSVCVSSNAVWVADAGNCRILKYDTTGKFIGQIAYLPMNYNCGVDQNNPKRVFAKELEFEVNYETMQWRLVANWGYGAGAAYQYAGDNMVRNFLSYPVTTSTGTYAIVRLENNRDHAVVQLTETGLKEVKRYEHPIALTKDGKAVYKINSNGKANFYIDGAIKETVTITSESALNSNSFVGYTDDGSFVVYNGDKEHKGFHLTWVKGGQIKNAMPSRDFTEAQSKAVPFPYGDFFATGFYPTKNGAREGYAGSDKVYIIGNRVFVNYLGEFFGNDGGQTNLWYEYTNATFVKRVGMTVYESYALDGNTNPRVQAGNSWAGGVVYYNGSTYIFTNCEHTSAIQWFQY